MVQCWLQHRTEFDVSDTPPEKASLQDLQREKKKIILRLTAIEWALGNLLEDFTFTPNLETRFLSHPIAQELGDDWSSEVVGHLKRLKPS